MKHNITDIYRIETMNSVYMIKVVEQDTDVLSVCQKMGANNRPHTVNEKGTSYLEKLTIGASFEVPGVVTTSVVQDYQHFVLSEEPKRTTTERFFLDLARQIKVEPQLVAEYQEKGYGPERVYKGYGPGCSEDNHVGSCTCDLPPTCTVPGCTWSSKHGPSHDGSRMCKSGSIASGGTRAHCACDYCY